MHSLTRTGLAAAALVASTLALPAVTADLVATNLAKTVPSTL